MPTTVRATGPSNVTFPLPPEMVPKITLTDADVAEYKHISHEVVTTTLGMEIQYRYRDLAMLNPQDWKFIKAKERFRVYKRLTPDEELVSMVLGVGFMEGTLENAFYGLHHKTTEEMRMTTTFVNKNILDTAVLATLESGTDDQPYRYMGLKWRVARTPGGNLIKNRDVCNLESMGIATDTQGIKYGFHLLKSVEIPGFPVYPESIVVRAQMMLCCIYRQLSPNLVSFYSKGVFDLQGELPEFLAYNTSADMVLSISLTIDCGAAKRLTLLLMQSDREHSERTSKQLTEHQIRDSTDSMQSSSSSLANSSSKLVSASDGSLRGVLCSLCQKKPPLLSFSCKSCRICREPVCARCYVKPKVLALPRNFRIVCCKACVVKSREIPVDPRDPYPIINGSQFQRRKSTGGARRTLMTHEASRTTETDC